MVRPAAALPTLQTNSADLYTQNWYAVRPNNYGTFNYLQTVVNHNHDSNTEVLLSTEVYQLIQPQGSGNGPDFVSLRLTLNANSRYGIQYSPSYSTLSSSSYPISYSRWTDLGTNAMTVTLQYSVFFFGDVGTHTNEYSKIYVSPAGYLSVNGPSSKPAGTLDIGMIAPFSRLFYSSHMYMYYDPTFSITWFAWVAQSYNDPYQVNCCTPEIFLVKLDNWANTSLSPFRESGIEFWYHSISPHDGIPTTIGIADGNYGTNKVSVSPDNLQATDYSVTIVASSGPTHLTSLNFAATDTSGSTGDPFAMVSLDSPTDPAGYNVALTSGSPPVVPDYAVTAISAAAEVGALVFTDGTAGLLFNTIPGQVAFGLDSYNKLVQAYWQASLITNSQQSMTDTADTTIKSGATQGGSTSCGCQLPVDSSLSVRLLWKFADNDAAHPRIITHHMKITAKAGYLSPNGANAVVSSIPAADTASVSTSVDLEFDPDYLMYGPDTFSGINAVYQQSSTPSAQWTTTTQCSTGSSPGCFSGASSAYSGNSPNTNYWMSYSWGNLANYAQAIAILHVWVPNGGYFYIDYLSSNGWINAVTLGGGSDSAPRSNTAYTRWQNPMIRLPPSATAIRFSYVTSDSAPPVGAYIGEFSLFTDGTPSYGGADVHVSGRTPSSSPLAVPVSMDGGASITTGVHFLATTVVSHQFSAPLQYIDNTGMYNFVSWSTNGGICSITTTSTSTICTYYVTAPLELFLSYNPQPDFAISANPAWTSIYGGYSGTETITVNSRNGWIGTVTLSITVSPSSGLSVSCNPTSLQLTQAVTSLSSACTLSAPYSSSGTSYTVTFTGSGGSLTRSVQVPVSVCCSGGGGGSGGSIAHGSLITMADGSRVPVQNLSPGDVMLGYDTDTNSYRLSIIKSISIVDTPNMLVIHTALGVPFRVDANPRQTLWVKSSSGVSAWTPVTQIKPGDDLFTPDGWTPVTRIEFAPSGSHIMYDIIASAPYFADNYLDPLAK